MNPHLATLKTRVAHLEAANRQPAAKSTFAEVALEIRSKGFMALATSFGSTLSGQDGGYAVPQDTANEIMMYPTGALLPLCSQVPVRGGSIGVPLDACTPWNDSGIVAYWPDEGDEIEPSKPNLELTRFELKKLTALVPVSDELLEDSAALEAWLPLAMQEAVKVKVNEAIIAGVGAGRPLGILHAPSKIVVDKEGSQAAATITDANITAMLDRHLDATAAGWLLNPGAYGAVTGLSKFDSASRTLAGLPIVLSDACKALGSEGDLILANMAGYVVASKAAQLAQSTHLWFDADQSAFRLTFRFDGSPMLSGPVSPPNSAVTKSHFVTLAERA